MLFLAGGFDPATDFLGGTQSSSSSLSSKALFLAGAFLAAAAGGALGGAFGGAFGIDILEGPGASESSESLSPNALFFFGMVLAPPFTGGGGSSCLASCLAGSAIFGGAAIYGGAAIFGGAAIVGGAAYTGGFAGAGVLVFFGPSSSLSSSSTFVAVRVALFFLVIVGFDAAESTFK